MTRQLRQLIRVMRTDNAKLTQRAAGEACGLSEIWWRQVEGGHTDYTADETLAKMCYAVGVTPRQLRKIDQGHLAELVEVRRGILDEAEPDTMEAYLMQTPELTDAQRKALITVAQTLRNS